MFKIGDIIQRQGRENYSHSSIYSGSFVITGIKDNEYELQQSNYLGNMDIETVNNLFIINDNPKGHIVNISNHILKRNSQ